MHIAYGIGMAIAVMVIINLGSLALDLFEYIGKQWKNMVIKRKERKEQTVAATHI